MSKVPWDWTAGGLRTLYTFGSMMPPDNMDAIFDEGAMIRLSKFEFIFSAFEFRQAPQWLWGTAY